MPRSSEDVRGKRLEFLAFPKRTGKSQTHDISIISYIFFAWILWIVEISCIPRVFFISPWCLFNIFPRRIPVEACGVDDVAGATASACQISNQTTKPWALFKYFCDSFFSNPETCTTTTVILNSITWPIATITTFILVLSRVWLVYLLWNKKLHPSQHLSNSQPILFFLVGYLVVGVEIPPA